MAEMDRLIRQVVDRVDTDYIVALLKDLIEIPSPNPPGDCRAISERVEREMRAIGIPEIEAVEPAEGRRTIFGRMGQGRGATITLVSHVDVVPVREDEKSLWQTPPLAATIKDGKMYGRGASDTKSGVACVLAAEKAIVESGIEIPGKVIHIADADGEVAHIWGVKYFDEHGYIGGDMAISCDPSNLQIIQSFKGRVWFEVEVRGVATHASVPDEGINAISKMMKVLDALEHARLTFVRDPLLGDSTIGLTTIQGGSVPNATAGYCKAGFDVRLVPGQTVSGVTSELQSVLDALKREDPELDVSLGILPGSGRDPFETPIDSGIVRSATAGFKLALGRDPVYGAGIESPGSLNHFRARGAGGIFFGPGNIRLAHLPNEHVELENLPAAAKVYVGTILKAMYPD